MTPSLSTTPWPSGRSGLSNRQVPTGTTPPDMGDEMNEQQLPTDQRTGISAIAVLPSGRIVWPMIGGASGEAGDGGAAASGEEGGPDEGTGGEAGAGTAVDHAAEAAKWKALARKHEAEAKKNKTAADRVAALEDADKSEIQRERDKAAAAEARAKAAEHRADRLDVAAAKGLSPSLAARLVGETREELEADADELLKVVKPADGTSGASNGTAAASGAADGRARPREALRSGSAPGVEPEDNDPTKLAALIPRG